MIPRDKLATGTIATPLPAAITTDKKQLHLPLLKCGEMDNGNQRQPTRQLLDSSRPKLAVPAENLGMISLSTNLDKSMDNKLVNIFSITFLPTTTYFWISLFIG